MELNIVPENLGAIQAAFAAAPEIMFRHLRVAIDESLLLAQREIAERTPTGANQLLRKSILASNAVDFAKPNGSSEASMYLIGGKRKIAFSFTVDAYTGGLLNNLYYGEEAQNKQQTALPCLTPYTIPESLSKNAIIRLQKAVHLGRFDADISVSIGGTVATKDTAGTPVAQHYLLDDGTDVYTFSKSDIGKAFDITLDSNGTVLVLHGKITDTLTFNPHLIGTTTYTAKKNASSLTDGTALTVTPYRPNNAIGSVDVVQASYDGILAFIPPVCQLEQSSGKTDKATDWGALYTHLCMTFGWDYHYVDGQMTLSKLHELRGYLDDHPATHLLVAAYLGYENPNKTNSPQAFFDRLRAIYGKPRRH